MAEDPRPRAGKPRIEGHHTRWGTARMGPPPTAATPGPGRAAAKFPLWAAVIVAPISTAPISLLRGHSVPVGGTKKSIYTFGTANLQSKYR